MLEYLLHRNPGLLGLSEVQLELLRMLAEGCTDKEIAAQKGQKLNFLRWGQRCVLIILNDWMRVSKKVTMLCAIGVRKPAGTKEQLP